MAFPFNASGDDYRIIDFNYPQEVSKEALADLDNALKAGDGELTVDALVRYSIAQSGISKDNMTFDSISKKKATDCTPEETRVTVEVTKTYDLPEFIPYDAPEDPDRKGDNKALFARALEAAKAADLVIFVAGTDSSTASGVPISGKIRTWSAPSAS